MLVGYIGLEHNGISARFADRRRRFVQLLKIARHQDQSGAGLSKRLPALFKVTPEQPPAAPHLDALGEELAAEFTALLGALLISVVDGLLEVVLERRYRDPARA